MLRQEIAQSRTLPPVSPRHEPVVSSAATHTQVSTRHGTALSQTADRTRHETAGAACQLTGGERGGDNLPVLPLHGPGPDPLPPPIVRPRPPSVALLLLHRTPCPQRGPRP
eukprot:2724333-Rhodomonas_salina.2